jgi:plastocyanin
VKGMRANRGAVGLALAIGLLLAGCGGDDGAGVRSGSASASGSGSASGPGSASGTGSASGAGAAACKPAGEAGTGATEVSVDLKEWSVTPMSTSVAAGDVTFEARNTGKEPHELVIAKGDDASKLPRAADGKVDEDKLPQGASIGEIEEFPAGQSCSGTFELTAGKYVLFCNILEQEGGTTENHFANGMRTVIDVT